MRLKVQSPLKKYLLSLNTFTLLWLTELEQSTVVVQINGSVQDTLWTPEIDMKHMKRVEGHIARKCFEHNNKDDFNSLNIISNNNYQTLSQKFSQITYVYIFICMYTYKYTYIYIYIYIYMFIYVRVCMYTRVCFYA